MILGIAIITAGIFSVAIYITKEYKLNKKYHYLQNDLSRSIDVYSKNMKDISIILKNQKTNNYLENDINKIKLKGLQKEAQYALRVILSSGMIKTSDDLYKMVRERNRMEEYSN